MSYIFSKLLLGLLYFFGYGVLQDYDQALHWFKKAAFQGDPEAQYHIGM